MKGVIFCNFKWFNTIYGMCTVACVVKQINIFKKRRKERGAG